MPVWRAIVNKSLEETAVMKFCKSTIFRKYKLLPRKVSLGKYIVPH